MHDGAIKKIVGHKIQDITEATYTERDIEWLREDIEKIPVAPTRKTGGSTDGYKPLMLGQRLKALAFALLQPLCF